MSLHSCPEQILVQGARAHPQVTYDQTNKNVSSKLLAMHYISPQHLGLEFPVLVMWIP